MMAENSGIEWTDHTFNPWWGCTKVSPACKNCYAATFAHRYNHDIWGKNKPRRFFGAKHWNEPLKWNKRAKATGQRARVFCASMADVFEGAETMPDDHVDLITAERWRLWALIEATPHLDWLLLTKRPENIMSMIPEHWREALPNNVWVGTTVENQAMADQRILHLITVPAVVRFLSCEPLQSSLDLSKYIHDLHWVIAGGESGTGAKPSHPMWFTRLQAQCLLADVSFFFKQWGEWAFYPNHLGQRYTKWGCLDVNGEWSLETTPWNGRQLAEQDDYECTMIRIGKKQAGRSLGQPAQLYSEIPVVVERRAYRVK